MSAAQQDASWRREDPGASLQSVERTCVGCRATDTKESLVRVVRGPEGQVVADPMARLPGRGAHVHLRAECLAQAVRGGLARAFRAPVEVSGAALAGAFEERLDARRTGLIVAARRAAALAIGTDAVREAVSSRRAALLLVAQDAAGRREELSEAVERLGRACLEMGTKAELGALLGRNEVGVAAVLDRGIADAIVAVSTDIAAATAARTALHHTRSEGARQSPRRSGPEGGQGSVPARDGRRMPSGGRTPR